MQLTKHHLPRKNKSLWSLFYTCKYLGVFHSQWKISYNLHHPICLQVRLQSFLFIEWQRCISTGINKIPFGVSIHQMFCLMALHDISGLHSWHTEETSHLHFRVMVSRVRECSGNISRWSHRPKKQKGARALFQANRNSWNRTAKKKNSLLQDHQVNRNPPAHVAHQLSHLVVPAMHNTA